MHPSSNIMENGSSFGLISKYMNGLFGDHTSLKTIERVIMCIYNSKKNNDVYSLNASTQRGSLTKTAEGHECLK